jgi:2-C-methyl-D-erythritol 4-phosphate cytidylyltransferase
VTEVSAGSGAGVWAVLVAAGRGERLGDERPKAFARLGERVLLAESLERLDASPWVAAIVVVAPPGWEEPVIVLAEERAAGKVAASVAGGATRTESVRIGVAHVPEEAVAILVHDAARPLVSDAVIERVLGPLGEGFDGAVPGLAVPDTVKRVDGARAVVETLPRAELVAVQTPQAFVAPALRAALDRQSDEMSLATDCSSLVEANGGRVRVVEGDPRLVKVTTRADMALVESWLDG